MGALNSAAPARPKTDRFLVGILVGIGVLLVLGVASIFLVNRAPQEIAADSASATVQAFYLAMQKQDYNQAYDYLSDSMKYKPARDAFIFNILRNKDQQSQPVRVSVVNEKVYGDQAVVDASLEYYEPPSGPFSGPENYSYTESFDLQQEQGAWRITRLPYRYMP